MLELHIQNIFQGCVHVCVCVCRGFNVILTSYLSYFSLYSFHQCDIVKGKKVLPITMGLHWDMGDEGWELFSR